MRSNHCLISLFCAALGLATTAQADPYSELPTFDFGKSSGVLSTIQQEILQSPPAALPAIESKLLGALANPNATYACKKFVCEQLRLIGSDACVAPLLKLLADERSADLARLALEALPSPAAGDGLSAALTTSTGKVRIGILNSLAARHHPGLPATLAPFLASGSPDLIRAALQALARPGSAEAVSVLQSAKLPAEFDAQRERALVEAATGLAQSGKKEAAVAVFDEVFRNAKSSAATVAALNGLADFGGAQGMARLVSALKGTRAPVALAAAKAAQRSREAPIAAELSAALPGLSAPVQVAVIRTLSERGDKQALPAVKTALSSEAEPVRTEAALALEKLGASSAIPALIELAAKEGDAAAAAQQTLGRINAAGVNEAMSRMLDGADAKTVRMAALTLRARAERSILPRLLAMAGGESKDLRGAAIDALDGFAGDAEIPALLRLLDKADNKDKLASILWKATAGLGIEDERFAQLWSRAASCPEPSKAVLISLASNGGGAQSLQIAADTFNSGLDALKDPAARALFSWKTDAAVGPILEVATKSPDPKHKILGARAAVRLVSDRKCNWKAEKKQEHLAKFLPLLTRPEDKKLIEDAVAAAGQKS